MIIIIKKSLIRRMNAISKILTRGVVFRILVKQLVKVHERRSSRGRVIGGILPNNLRVM